MRHIVTVVFFVLTL